MIKLDNYSFTFDAQGSEVYVHYISDNPVTGETITSQPDWVETEVNKDSAEEGNITIIVQPNDDLTRSSTIEFEAYDRIDGIMLYATIDINQLPAQEIVGNITIKSIKLDDEITDTPVNMNEFNHQVIVDLNTTLIQTINVINTSSWVSLYSQGDNEYIFNINANPSDQRASTITFEAFDVLGNRLTADVRFIQAQHYEVPVVFSVENSYVKAEAAAYILNVTHENVQSYEITDYPEWLTVEEYDLDTVTISYEYNPTYKDREGVIVYNVTDTQGFEHQFTSEVFQSRSVFSGQYPIWQDVYVPIPRTSPTETNITYVVSVFNSETGIFEQIYKGNAIFVNNDAPEINLTEIVRNYVKDTLDIEAELGSTQKTENIAVMLNTEEPEPNLVASLYYYYDYSFDKDFKVSRNMPILDYFDVRQDLFLSFLNLSGETNNVLVGFGRRQLRLTFDKPGIFHNKRQYPEGNVNIIAPDKQTLLTAKNTCCKYAIYYLNPLGGWDQMLIEGKVVQTLKITNNTYKKQFNNNTIEFENKHYLKNLTTTYKMTTGFLTDEQSKLMPNLIKTTKAYLCNLETNKYTPILINNNSVDIKTYRNQGRKLFTYTIEVQESQNKFIK